MTDEFSLNIFYDTVMTVDGLEVISENGSLSVFQCGAPNGPFVGSINEDTVYVNGTAYTSASFAFAGFPTSVVDGYYYIFIENDLTVSMTAYFEVEVSVAVDFKIVFQDAFTNSNLTGLQKVVFNG